LKREMEGESGEQINTETKKSEVVNKVTFNPDLYQSEEDDEGINLIRGKKSEDKEEGDEDEEMRDEE
jgi:hypothetical protein